MYLSFDFLSLILIILFNIHSSSSSSSSICSQYYPSLSDHHPRCECDDIPNNIQSTVSLKCIGSSTIPPLLSNINYKSIEFESCHEDLNFGDKPFNNIHLNILRIRHCNLTNLNNQTFSNVNQFEKFSLENSTIKSLLTTDGNLQEIFSSKSFQTLKSLTLKSVHYHQIHAHDKKLNFELLLEQLPRLSRLELNNIYLDNYRYYQIHSVGQDLTYLSLTNTRQTSLLPIEYFLSLERLLIRDLPDIFHSQPLISSLEKLPKLKYILFEQDQLEHLANLKSNTIDDIDLSSNLIQSIDEYTFEYVPKLRHLTLSGNPLNSIDKNAFCGIQNLQRLSIHIKHRDISPLDNCLLIHYPNLHIIQNSQTNLQCNCQLMSLFQLQTNEINRIFQLNQVCLWKNETVQKTIPLYELETSLNCSMSNQCQRLCQERKTKVLLTTISSNIKVNPKYTSLSMSTYSFFSYLLFLLLLAFLYL